MSSLRGGADKENHDWYDWLSENERICGGKVQVVNRDNLGKFGNSRQSTSPSTLAAVVRSCTTPYRSLQGIGISDSDESFDEGRRAKADQGSEQQGKTEFGTYLLRRELKEQEERIATRVLNEVEGRFEVELLEARQGEAAGQLALRGQIDEIYGRLDELAAPAHAHVGFAAGGALAHELSDLTEKTRGFKAELEAIQQSLLGQLQPLNGPSAACQSTSVEMAQLVDC